MTQTQAQYINKNFKKLANYINHLANFSKKYNEGVKNLCSKSNASSITKSEETLKYEKEMKESYDKAMELYNDLKLIADKYRSRMNINSDLQWFHNKLNSTRLPIYKKAKLKLESSNQDGIATGGAANINHDNKYNIKDEEFNIHFNLKNIFYYKKEVNDKLEKEVGDKLRSINIDNDNWSNDLRHQYVSAVYARNLGEKMAKILGDLNEFFDANQSGRYDKARDQINNEIGRQYGLKFSDISRAKLLDILVSDYNNNLKIIKSKLKEKGF